MELIKVFNASPAAALLSNDGMCATDKATATVNNIKAAAKAKGMYVTYWNDGKVTFTCIYSHTSKVPARALQDLASFQAWNINRINHYFAADKAKLGIL
jgi:hypothetical protein